MSTPSKEFSFSLRPSTIDDVSSIAKLSAQAQARDRNTLVKYGGENYMERLEAMFAEGVPSWFNNPKLLAMKAVDDSTGEMIGSVCWGFHAYPEIDARKAEMDKKRAESASQTQAPSDPQVEPMHEASNKGKELNDFTGAHFMDMINRVLNPPGVRTMFFMGISVLPAYQGKGVGSALIKFGTDRADKDGVKLWVHSSEAGYKAFAKAGFEVVETLTFDLDKYTNVPMIDEAGHEQKWGTYTFRYMQRNPTPQTL